MLSPILGSPITLALTIDREKGTAHFDFSGTGFEVYGVFEKNNPEEEDSERKTGGRGRRRGGRGRRSSIFFIYDLFSGNCNAPVAVTKSAIIYCLRCLVKRDIPLNQGCLNPIGIIHHLSFILALSSSSLSPASLSSSSSFLSFTTRRVS